MRKGDETKGSGGRREGTEEKRYKRRQEINSRKEIRGKEMEEEERREHT